MSLSKPRGKSWSYWFWKLADDLGNPHKKMKCTRHNWVLKYRDERIGQEYYKCTGCGKVRTKF